MEIERVKEALQSFLEKQNIHLYDVSVRREEQEQILEIVLDESFDLNQLSAISLNVSREVEGWEFVPSSTLLDITCVGVERELRNLEEVKKHVSHYVFLRLQNDEEIEGDLLKVEGNDLLLRVRNKNLYKERHVLYDDVVFARLAVKF